MKSIWPPLLYIALSFIGVGIEMAKHGEQKQGKHNVWTTCVAWLIILSVLYWGGFFDPLFKR